MDQVTPQEESVMYEETLGTPRDPKSGKKIPKNDEMKRNEPQDKAGDKDEKGDDSSDKKEREDLMLLDQLTHEQLMSKYGMICD